MPTPFTEPLYGCRALDLQHIQASRAAREALWLGAVGLESGRIPLGIKPRKPAAPRKSKAQVIPPQILALPPEVRAKVLAALGMTLPA